MSDHRDKWQNSGDSHATAWITVIVAVPLLYLLTLPGVVAVAVPAGSIAVTPPLKWLVIYATPAAWLCKSETFGEVYAAYCQWCWKTVLRRTDIV